MTGVRVLNDRGYVIGKYEFFVILAVENEVETMLGMLAGYTFQRFVCEPSNACLLYTSDAADE